MKPEPKDREEKDQREHDERVEQARAADREIDPEFQRIARENLERYRVAMEELAK